MVSRSAKKESRANNFNDIFFGSELTDSLKKGIDEIKSCALNIGQMQVCCGMRQPAQDYVEQVGGL